MLVFSGFTPHSPLLLPEVNQDQLHLVQATIDAMDELAEDLYAAHPDTILLISEHPTIYEDAFSVTLADPYHFDLSEFGVLDVQQKYRPNLKLIDRLQRSLRRAGHPITLTTEEALNYASAVPLMLLTQQLPQVKLIPVTYSELDPKAHFQFGQALKDEVMHCDSRVAVIASGDMSHALSSNSPAGFHRDGTVYDEKIQELVTHKNTAGLLSLEEDLIINAQQTSYRPLTILFGLLERVSVKPSILSYEAPFDVGYLVANFILK